MKGIGTVLLVVGIGLFLVYEGGRAISLFLSEMPLHMKVAFFATGMGLLLMMLDVARDTWRKKDR